MKIAFTQWKYDDTCTSEGTWIPAALIITVRILTRSCCLYLYRQDTAKPPAIRTMRSARCLHYVDVLLRHCPIGLGGPIRPYARPTSLSWKMKWEIIGDRLRQRCHQSDYETRVNKRYSWRIFTRLSISPFRVNGIRVLRWDTLKTVSHGCIRIKIEAPVTFNF